MFHVGQKVIYVGRMGRPRDLRFPASKPEFRLTKGSTYTIRDVDWRAAHEHHGIPTVRLEEMVRPIVNGWEAGYCPWGFRPVRDYKTDISIFTAMLKPSPTREHETVLTSQDHPK